MTETAQETAQQLAADAAAIRQGAEEAAGKYAWEYFKYHAGQRQAVFRFYLFVVAACLVSFGYSRRGVDNANAGNPLSVAGPLGLILTVLSFIFWRLDQRSRSLIKLAEGALKI